MKTRLASIYFAPLHADRSAYGAIYDIPAVAKGAEPFVLTVKDEVSRWFGPYDEGHKMLTRIVPGEKIADDIFAHWTKMGLGMTADCHPGVWIVRDRIPAIDDAGKPIMDLDAEGKPVQAFRDATKEEFARMWAEDLAHAKTADANFAEYLMGQATIKDQDPRQREFLDPRSRLAAKQYGKDFPWLHKLSDSETAPCASCGTQIIGTAAICPICKGPANLQRYGELEAAKQRAIEAAMKPKPIMPPTGKQQSHAA